MKWMRGVGITGVLIGLGGILFGEWFWPVVVLIYISLLAILIDVWFEPELVWKWKIGATAGTIALAAFFSWGIVFVRAPLPVTAMITDAGYPSGTNIHGIVWKTGFTELRLTLFNPSNYNYRNIALSIQPVEPIAAIVQSTNIPGVVFYDNHRLTASPIDINFMTGQRTALPMVILATDAGYTMHCPLLLGGTSVEIVMALAEMKYPQKPPIEEKNKMFRIKFDDGSAYWIGYQDGDDYLPQRPSTTTVKVKGQYDAARRRWLISEKVKVSGQLPLSVLR
ncbi:MAG: hypothetical protein ACREE2_15325 [Stellaceae bacterium]